jgi:hypothetical protein
MRIDVRIEPKGQKMEALTELCEKAAAVADDATGMAETETDHAIRGELIAGAQALRDFAGTLELRIEVLK